MAIPKKKSRKINLNDIDYRWVANGNDHGIDVYIELAKEPAQLLQAVADYEYDKNKKQIAITSSHIKQLIESALNQGWQPNLKGPVFKLKKNIKLKHV